MSAILEFKNVSYHYEDGGKKVNILDGINFPFEKGKFYTLLGPSGCGKTTTLALASALDVPRSGEIFYDGKSIKEIGLTNYRNSKIGIVFQSYNLINYMNALQNVTTAMEITRNKIHNKKEKAYELLEKVGLTRDEADRNIMRLSGGQQQRVAIARALSTNAELILADEPTGNLDQETALEIIQIFRDLAHVDGKCVIVVTHSNEVAKLSDVVLKFGQKKLVVA
jgi:putative ABC transport system ATP-binding protein